MSDPSPRLVLLVDDDLRTARRMADMLREDGFTVEIARDGAAAIARLTRTPVPDAVVTELNLAHADGAAVGQFARTRRPRIPIVVLTGYPHLFHPAAFGFDPPLLLTKPVDYESLRNALSNQLATAALGDLPSLDGNPQLESAPTNAQGDAVSGAQAVRPLQRA